MNAMEQKRREMFGITNEFTALEDAVLTGADADTGEIDGELVGIFDRLQMSAEAAVLGAAGIYREAVAEAEMYKQEEKRLAEERARLESRIETFKAAIENFCKRTGIEKIDGMHAKVGFKKNPPSVKFDDVERVPEEFFRTKVVTEIDKTAVKKAIQTGREVPGAYLEQERKFYIK